MTVDPLLPTVPLDVVAGEPMSVTVPVIDPAGQPVPAAQLSSARAQVRATPGADGVLVEFSTSSGSGPRAEITTDGILLTASAAVTATWQAWPVRGPVWDLLVVDSSLRPIRLCAPSAFRVHPGVTR